jgi:hypothetical protein
MVEMTAQRAEPTAAEGRRRGQISASRWQPGTPWP